MNLERLARDFDRKYAAMTAERARWEPRWREMAEQFAPARGRFSLAEEGKTDTLRRNSRPRDIAEKSASNFFSGLTSPSRPWFSLSIFDPELSQFERVKAWLSDTTEAMLTRMARSNLYDQLFPTCKEELVFGTACLYIDEDDEDAFTCRALTVGQYAIGQNAKKRVNRFARTLSYTARELARTFGEENLPAEIVTILRDDEVRAEESGTAYEVRHLVEENDEYAPDAPGQEGMRYRSLYRLAAASSGVNEKPFLRVGGYHEFPVMAPRWRLVGEDLYGSEHPGQAALDDAKTIQDIETDERRALKLKIKPPLLVPESMRYADIDQEPGHATYYMATSPNAAPPVIIPLFATNFDHAAAAEKVERLTRDIGKAFYTDLFQLWASDPRQGRTATEAEFREQEKNYALEPVLNRQIFDLLDPTVIRVYNIMRRRGELPPPPPEMEGRTFKIEYTSVLAKAQKQASQYGLQTVIAVAGQMAEMQGAAGERPAILDKLDMDTVLDLYADMHGVPTGAVLGEDAVARVRAEKDEQARQREMQAASAEMAAAAPQLAGAAKDLGQTPMGGGTALDALMTQGQGGGQPI
jgi:hypothetical protein